uniref:Uncharacterized protein n=1 Tax=Molossus molossus TaxID=27622 RepID=A0A7J8BKQ3_MOLMO|nr:hypothetical protein HJG59_010180 [Molossus molossus]
MTRYADRHEFMDSVPCFESTVRDLKKTIRKFFTVKSGKRFVDSSRSVGETSPSYLHLMGRSAQCDLTKEGSIIKWRGTCLSRVTHEGHKQNYKQTNTNQPHRRDNRTVVTRGEGKQARMRKVKGVKHKVTEEDFGVSAHNRVHRFCVITLYT